MRLLFLCCPYLLGQTAAAPIAQLSLEGDLYHAVWANLCHRRLFSDALDTPVRLPTYAHSRDTTTLRQSPFHLASYPPDQDYISPNCIASATSLDSVHLPTDPGKMPSTFLYCALMAAVGLVFGTALLVSRCRQRPGVLYPDEGRHTDDVGTKKEPQSSVGDEEISDDFDDTDYPMG